MFSTLFARNQFSPQNLSDSFSHAVLSAAMETLIVNLIVGQFFVL